MTNIEIINKKLEQIALKTSTPFCYHCYVKAPSGICNKCFSDDLMRATPEGIEYGVDWIIAQLVKDNISPINLEESFEDFCREIYPETVKVGWMELDTVQVMKDNDPISWNLSKSEWIDNEVQDEIAITFDNGSTYYWTYEVESFIEKFDQENEEAG